MSNKNINDFSNPKIVDKKAKQYLGKNVKIKLSDKPIKKYMVLNPNTHKYVYFGQMGYEDFTKHNDTKSKERYIARHSRYEIWTKSGVDTAGWLSRFILWEKPTLKGAIEHVNKRYSDVQFKLYKF